MATSRSSSSSDSEEAVSRPMRKMPFKKLSSQQVVVAAISPKQRAGPSGVKKSKPTPKKKIAVQEAMTKLKRILGWLIIVPRLFDCSNLQFNGIIFLFVIGHTDNDRVMKGPNDLLQHVIWMWRPQRTYSHQ